MQRINVARRGSSFNLAAPVYVQALRNPPNISKTVDSTSPLYGTSTVFPSDDLYSATPPKN